MKHILKFNSPDEMKEWLKENEGKQITDNFGRSWKFVSSDFYFKDIGTRSVYKKAEVCFHLYGTNIGYHD